MDALELLVQQTDEKLAQLKEHLAAGRATSFEEYKSVCGEVRGLLIARGYILDLKKNLEESDD
jgi:hypothetical protein